MARWAARQNRKQRLGKQWRASGVTSSPAANTGHRAGNGRGDGRHLSSPATRRNRNIHPGLATPSLRCQTTRRADDACSHARRKCLAEYPWTSLTDNGYGYFSSRRPVTRSDPAPANDRAISSFESRHDTVDKKAKICHCNTAAAISQKVRGGLLPSPPEPHGIRADHAQRAACARWRAEPPSVFGGPAGSRAAASPGAVQLQRVRHLLHFSIPSARPRLDERRVTAASEIIHARSGHAQR